MREKRSSGLNIGSASIIMLFAVLCLTVLSALSLLSATSQMKLAQRSADVATSYYAADLLASGIFENVKAGDLSAVETRTADGVTYYDYTVPIDEHQSLAVSLCDKGGSIAVYRWKMVEATGWEWTPDDTFDLWTGD